MIEMADEAVRENSEENNEGPEFRPYNKKYYGAIADIDEFNKKHKK